MLYGNKVYVFGITEAPYDDPYKPHVPTVVVIPSPVPPSDKMGIKAIQREVEEIIPMKQMKMYWLPYIPFEKRDRQVDRMNIQIFTLGCTQRRSALRHMKEDRLMKFNYCIPYFYSPFKELEQSTVVEILFPSEPPVVCDFDWRFDKLEEFVDQLIEDQELCAEQKDEFKRNWIIGKELHYFSDYAKLCRLGW